MACEYIGLTPLIVSLKIPFTLNPKLYTLYMYLVPYTLNILLHAPPPQEAVAAAPDLPLRDEQLGGRQPVSARGKHLHEPLECGVAAALHRLCAHRGGGRVPRNLAPGAAAAARCVIRGKGVGPVKTSSPYRVQ